MTNDIQRQIDRAVGLGDVRCDPSDVEDVIAQVARSAPAATVSDLSENVDRAIREVERKLEAALDALNTLKGKVDNKPADDLVLTAFLGDVERSLSLDEDASGAGKAWLLGPAIAAYKAGDATAIERFIEAAPHLDDCYGQCAISDVAEQHSLVSLTVDAYTTRACEYVKGRVADFSSYDDFIDRLELSR